MSEQPTRADRTRQVVVVVSHLVGVLGVLTGVGVIGTEVSESSSGALSADATLLAPAGTAFSIWSLIYALLTAYAIYQLFPSTATDPRHRRTGYLAAASMLLNAAWIFVTQWGLLWLSVVVIVALLLVLGALVARLHDRPAVGAAEALLVDGTFGLYLGWVCVATCANVAAALVGYGVETSQGVGEVVAVAVIVVVVGVAAALARRGAPPGGPVPPGAGAGPGAPRPPAHPRFPPRDPRGGQRAPLPPPGQEGGGGLPRRPAVPGLP
ncbi:tryptophan-rich sensory protein, partial [Janibacter melonis]|uniref:tryptophan-rich sensory protein n=1 Tax=Janibacter melonis TaxID=262209 RepID=UPI001CD88B3C|nr:tryptophan-rich sensory protein [Janibacter melonis]